MNDNSDPAPATYLIKDYDFARSDNDITNYKRVDGTDLQMGDNLAADNYHTYQWTTSGSYTYTLRFLPVVR